MSDLERRQMESTIDNLCRVIRMMISDFQNVAPAVARVYREELQRVTGEGEDVADKILAGDQCSATHNPGEWPYVARCVKKPHDGYHHVDARGCEWIDEGPGPSAVWCDHDADGLRDEVRRQWPQLADALDAQAMAASMRAKKN